MTRPVSRLLRRLALTVVLLVCTSCSSLFDGGGPAQLYRVTPASTYPANLLHRSVQLLVDHPLAPAGLDTSRIALSRSPLSIEYFADSEWAERTPLLLQTALLQSFENSRAITAIGRESADLRADFILDPEIRHFEAVYDSPNGAPEAWVAINVQLINPSSREVVARSSFARRQRASANDVPAIISAFDEALAGVMTEIVVWTITNPVLSIRHS